MGTGSLYERVEHEVTGFVTKNKTEFVKYSSLVLKNDNVYLNLKKNLSKKRNSRNYKHVKSDLIKIIGENMLFSSVEKAVFSIDNKSFTSTDNVSKIATQINK